MRMRKFEVASVDVSPNDFPGNAMDSGINELIVTQDRDLVVGVFEGRTGEFHYRYATDEVVYVLEGEYRLEDLVTGAVLDVKEGELVHIPKGAHLHVTLVRTPFRCLFAAHNDVSTLA